MKQSTARLGIGAIIILVLVGGFLVLRPKPTVDPVVEEVIEELPPSDPSIIVTLTKSKTKDDTISIAMNGLAGKVSGLSYELTYETEGLIQGSTSGNKPLDVLGDTFERDVYLGTCSKNVCRAHPSVKKVTLTVIFVDAVGQKSQFTKDYDI